MPEWEKIVEAAQSLGSQEKTGEGGNDDGGVYEQGVRRDCDTIRYFLLYLLKRWEAELDKREESIKRSVPGRQETQTFKQTVVSIKPLLDRLKSYTCIYDIRLHMTHIVRLCTLERDYIK